LLLIKKISFPLAKVIGYKLLNQFFRKIKRTVKRKGKKYVFAYWPKFDNLFHEQGGKSLELLEHARLLEKKIKDYKNFINRKDISVAMNIISEITQDFAINVVSIRPLRPKEKPLYTRHFFDVKLEASNYHEVGKFISKLESRFELYSVESLRIAPLYSYGQERRAMGVELTISTILLKD